MKNIKYAVFAFILTAFVLSLSPAVSAQAILTGTWKANEKSFKKKTTDDNESEKIHLNFRRDDRNGNWSNGSSYLLSDLQGLSRAQISGSNVSVKFKIIREAGTIECEGTFDNNDGDGTWRFIPNKSFVDAMQKRGFSFNDEKLFSAALLDVTVALA